MHLQNDFSTYVRSLFWSLQPYCQLCNSNENCSIHHIFGRSSASMFNGITLCYNCHKKADGHNTSSPMSMDFKYNLLRITYDVFSKDTFWVLYLPKVDEDRNDLFMAQHIAFYKNML